MYQSLLRMKFWDLHFRIENQLVRGSNLLALQYLLAMESMFFFLTIMCAILGITLFIFVCYHFYLIGEGQTTNERVKKNDYIHYLRREQTAIKKFMQQN
jgi:palmitoyltransferase